MIFVFGPTNTEIINSIENFCLSKANRLHLVNDLDDISSKNDDRKKIVITDKYSEWKSLANNFETILYVHINEDIIFSDIMLDRVTNEKYENEIRPLFYHNAKLLLDSAINIIAVNASSKRCINEIFSFLEKNKPIDPTNFIDIEKISQYLNNTAPNRDAALVWHTFDQKRKDFRKLYENKISKWLHDLTETDSLKRNLVIDEMIENFDFKRKFIAEEKNSIKLIFKSNKIVDIYSRKDYQPFDIILKEIHSILNRIESNNDNNNNILIRRVIGLETIFRFIFYRSSASHHQEYFNLIERMLNSECELIRVKSTDMLSIILDRSNKYAKNVKQDLFEKNFQTIYNSCEAVLCEKDPEKISELNYFYSSLSLLSLKIIDIKFIACKLSHLIRLIEIGMQSFQTSYHNYQARILCELMSISSRVIKICAKKGDINVNMLLGYASKMIQYTVNIFGSYSKVWLLMVTEFYNTLLGFALKYYFKDFDIEKLRYNTGYFDHKVVASEQIGNENENINKVVKAYSQFIGLKRENLIEESIKFLKDKTEYSIQYANLEAEVNFYKNSIVENEKKIKNFEEKLVRLEKDYEKKYEENEKISKLLSSFNNEKENLISKVDNKQFINDSNKQANSFEDEKILLPNDKESARLFIEKIKTEYDNLKDFRKLICGSLKHLSQNLYSTNTQFIYEIIQNTEDSFEIETNTDKENILKIEIDSNYILFSSNESGFTCENVKSICSLSESTKLKGQNIGHKGIGFKSVFTISNNPIIYSKPNWQFYFLKKDHDDEIAYIKPHYLQDDHIPPNLKQSIDKNESMNTFIYLPYKQNNKIFNDDFKQSLLKSIDRNVLLFTKKLNRIEIEFKNDSNKLAKRIIKRTKDNEKVLIEESLDEISSIEEFKLFEKKVQINDAFAKIEEEIDIDEIDISIAFSISNDKKQFGVYSFMPIPSENVYFPFIINSNWSLTTNREKIKDCLFNGILRDSLAKFYSELVFNDDDLRQNIVEILPSQSKNTWWNPFMEIIKQNINKKDFTTNDFKNKRFANDDLLNKFDVSKQILERLDIQLIECEHIAEMNLEFFFNCKKLSIEDIIEIFNKNSSDDLLEEWIKQRSGDWWTKLFGELYMQKVKVDARKYRIFSPKDENNLICLDENFEFFTCDDDNLKMWRKNIVFLNVRNDFEKKYLREYLSIIELTIPNVIEMIIAFHSQTLNIQDVWNDLKFLKNFYKQINRQLFMGLFVPTTKGLIPATRAKMATILGNDLSILPFVDSDGIVDFIQFSKSLNFYEILEWEHFLLYIGVNLADIDYDRIHLEIDCTQRPLDSYTEKEAELAFRILDDNKSASDFIKFIPVKCLDSAARNTQAVYVSHLFDKFFPSINVPSYALNLAEMIGINTKLNFHSCLKVLDYLCEKKSLEVYEYVKWLNIICAFRDEIEEKFDYKILIPLKDLNERIILISPSDVYFCEYDKLMEIICKNLNKSIICSSFNTEYLPLQSILTRFGSKSEPTIDDLIETINKTRQNIELTSEDGKILTNKEFSEMKFLYFEIEKFLRKMSKLEDYEEIDWQKRLNIKKLINNIDEKILSKTPIITYSKQIVENELLRFKKLVCSISPQINEQFFNNKVNSDNFIIANEEIAYNCPILMALLDCTYLEQLSVIKLSHLTNNMERTNERINNILRQEIGIEDLEILNVFYVGVSICFDPCLNEPIRKENYNGINFNTEKIDLEFDYVIFENKLVFCKFCRSKQIDYLAYKSFIYQLIKIKNLDQDENWIRNKVESCIEKIRQLGNPQMIEWSHGSREDTLYNMDDIYFPTNRVSYRSYAQMNKNHAHMNHYFIQSVKEGVNKFPLLNEPIRTYDFNKRRNDTMTLEEYKKSLEIGRIGEHYFSVRLQNIYSEFNISEHWVSSNKKKTYPRENDFDDNLGYDFIIEKDSKRYFSKNGNKCLIEVKSCNTQWDGTFFLSENQRLKWQETLNSNSNTSYIIVIIENTDDLAETNIAQIIDWTFNPNAIELKNFTYLANLNQKKKHEELFSNTNNSSKEINEDESFTSRQDQDWRRKPTENDSDNESGIFSLNSFGRQSNYSYRSKGYENSKYSRTKKY